MAMLPERSEQERVRDSLYVLMAVRELAAPGKDGLATAIVAGMGTPRVSVIAMALVQFLADGWAAARDDDSTGDDVMEWAMQALEKRLLELGDGNGRTDGPGPGGGDDDAVRGAAGAAGQGHQR